jgi:hypothetical protein
MKKNQIKGVMHDFLRYKIDFNPVACKVFLINKLEADLITGELFYPEEDDVSDFYKDKMIWFRERLISLGYKLKDFSEAKVMFQAATKRLYLNIRMVLWRMKYLGR